MCVVCQHRSSGKNNFVQQQNYWPQTRVTMHGECTGWLNAPWRAGVRRDDGAVRHARASDTQPHVVATAQSCPPSNNTPVLLFRLENDETTPRRGGHRACHHSRTITLLQQVELEARCSQKLAPRPQHSTAALVGVSESCVCLVLVKGKGGCQIPHLMRVYVPLTWTSSGWAPSSQKGFSLHREELARHARSRECTARKQHKR
jgi:hypothetical protein